MAPGPRAFTRVRLDLEDVVLVHLETVHDRLRIRRVHVDDVDGVGALVVHDLVHDDVPMSQLLVRLVPRQFDAGWADAGWSEVLRSATRDYAGEKEKKAKHTMRYTDAAVWDAQVL